MFNNALFGLFKFIDNDIFRQNIVCYVTNSFLFPDYYLTNGFKILFQPLIIISVALFSQVKAIPTIEFNFRPSCFVSVRHLPLKTIWDSKMENFLNFISPCKKKNYHLRFFETCKNFPLNSGILKSAKKTSKITHRTLFH